MNGEWTRMWKEKVVAYFKAVPALSWRNCGKRKCQPE